MNNYLHTKPLKGYSHNQGFKTQLYLWIGIYPPNQVMVSKLYLDTAKILFIDLFNVNR